MPAYRNPLTMLHIVSEVPSAVLINGVPAGRADGAGCGLPVSGETLVQVLPLGLGTPATALIHTDPPRLEAGGDMSLFAAGEGVLLLRVRLRAESPECLPHIILSKSFTLSGRSMRAFIYYDRVYGAALEENGDIVLAHMLAQMPTQPRIETFITKNGGLLAIFGGETAVFSLTPPALLASFPCAELDLSENGFAVTEHVEGLEAAKIRHTFTLSADGGTERKAAVSCIDAEKPCHALVCAVKQGDRAAADALLSPSLKRDVAFEDLCEFFGDFLCALPSEKGELLLAYPPEDSVSPVRRFFFECADGLVRDISEK